MRLLACGGRDFQDERQLRAWMNEAVDGHDKVVEIHGDARGADRLAGEIAARVGVPIVTFPADWTRHGAAAGPIRNQTMLDSGKPDLVLAAPGGTGTADMVRRAVRSGVPVIDKRERTTSAQQLNTVLLSSEPIAWRRQWRS